MSAERTVHRIEKRDGEEIRATVSEYRGEEYLSLRVYFRSQDGQWLPTRKGITLASSRLDELEIAITKLREHLAAEAAR